MAGNAAREASAPDVPEPWLAAVGGGISLIRRVPMLRALATQAAIWNATSGAKEALFILYGLRVLGLDAAGLGALFVVGGFGALIGSAVTPRLLRRFAFGRTSIVMVFIAVTGSLLTAAVIRPLPVAVTIVGLGQLLVGVGIGIGIARVQAVSLRQTITPATMLARTLATYRLLSYRVMPIGSVLGGLLGTALGLRPAHVIVSVTSTAAVLPLLLSPIRSCPTSPKDHTCDHDPYRPSARASRPGAVPGRPGAQRRDRRLPDRPAGQGVHPTRLVSRRGAGRLAGSAVFWTLPGNDRPSDLVLVEAPWDEADLTTGLALLDHAFATAKTMGVDLLGHVLDSPAQPPQFQRFPERRADLLWRAGFAQIRDGRRFQWLADGDLPLVDSRLRFRSLADLGSEPFVDLLAALLTDTADARLIADSVVMTWSVCPASRARA